MSSHNIENDGKDDQNNQGSISPSSSSHTSTVTRIKSWGRNVAVRTLSADDVLNGQTHNGSNQLERSNSRQRPTQGERPAVWTRGRKTGMEIDGSQLETERGATSPQAEHLQAQVFVVLALKREFLIIETALLIAVKSIYLV